MSLSFLAISDIVVTVSVCWVLVRHRTISRRSVPSKSIE